MLSDVVEPKLGWVNTNRTLRSSKNSNRTRETSLNLSIQLQLLRVSTYSFYMYLVNFVCTFGSLEDWYWYKEWDEVACSAANRRVGIHIKRCGGIKVGW
ncbi:hypothetical protein CEXT_210831 [Caerostris extrusa]|uniref:Uncharacterized protein n=1 Tax=Caerostris extrusa TaxID=172846 RepID=A0AAV4USH0_CAEEX|nr:hypothetical protein CEXT_210831 [Caerostris extrusa]